MTKYYISACGFTSRFPELSARMREAVRSRYGFTTVRCCVPKYKLTEITEEMPEGELRESWAAMPDAADLAAGDEVYTICHNCSNIIEETHPGIRVTSLWELLDSDSGFPLPDHHGMEVTLQDCWRSRERKNEQDAVRSLLTKMNIRFLEAEPNRENTEFCGASLYRKSSVRNTKLAPRHYVENAVGKFIPHTPEEQAEIMKAYCAGFKTGKVVCYCHHCLEGLLMGGAEGIHIAELLFAKLEVRSEK